MTNEEALDWLDQFTNNIIQTDIDTRKRTLVLQAIVPIKTALKKQIPKKPILDKEQTMRYVMTFTCPTCGKGFTGTKVCSYCYHCGQALDWSDM